MFTSIFRLTKKCERQYALHISLCIYSTFCFWLSKYPKQVLSWHGYTSQTSLGQPRPGGRVESGTRMGSSAPHPQWFPCRNDVGHPGNKRKESWLDLLLPPDLIFWSEENLKDALMMTVPVSCMELHWRIFLSLIDLQWYAAAWGLILVDAFSGMTHTQLKVVLRKTLAESLIDSCSLHIRGGGGCKEDLRFLQMLWSLSFVSDSSVWLGLCQLPLGIPSERGIIHPQIGIKDHTCLVHSRHSGHELGILLVLQETESQ